MINSFFLSLLNLMFISVIFVFGEFECLKILLLWWECRYFDIVAPTKLFNDKEIN